MIGSIPVFRMLFRHVFWSTRNQITYFAFGCSKCSESRAMLNDIPVARGRTMQSFASVIPQVWMKSSDSFLVNSQMRDDPAALGYSLGHEITGTWIAATSPARPIPWARP